MQKAALYTSGVVFATVAVAHVVRLTTGVGIVVDGVILPVWVSFLGALIAALLAIWMRAAPALGCPAVGKPDLGRWGRRVS